MGDWEGGRQIFVTPSTKRYQPVVVVELTLSESLAEIVNSTVPTRVVSPTVFCTRVVSPINLGQPAFRMTLTMTVVTSVSSLAPES